MRVLLFDIDGTLVNTGGAGGAALRHAFCQEFAVPEAGDVCFSGRTDRAIGNSLFRLHGVEDNTDNWQRLRAAYLQRLPLYMPQYPGQILPGVQTMLRALSGSGDVALGLLTGNLLEGARIKLEFFGLYHYFAFGGFGDDHHDRDLVARDALAAAHRYTNGRASLDAVWVIGDTPLDIACARAIHARVLAVATGVHPREELAAAAPDVLIDDLSDTGRVLEALKGSV